MKQSSYTVSLINLYSYFKFCCLNFQHDKISKHKNKNAISHLSGPVRHESGNKAELRVGHLYSLFTKCSRIFQDEYFMKQIFPWENIHSHQQLRKVKNLYSCTPDYWSRLKPLDLYSWYTDTPSPITEATL